MKSARAEVLALLKERQDLQYRDFTAKIIPNILKKSIIGVRSKDLKKAAQKAAGMKTEFMKALPHQYLEENLLHVLFLNQLKDYQLWLKEVRAFLPYVNNWAVADSMISRSALKKMLTPHLPELYGEIERFVRSDDVYAVRFGIGLLMNFYLDDEVFDVKIFELASQVKNEDYYVKMMLAWFMATALYRHYEAALPYLTNNRFDVWVRDKTIRKACESYRIEDEKKIYLKKINE